MDFNSELLYSSRQLRRTNTEYYYYRQLSKAGFEEFCDMSEMAEASTEMHRLCLFNASSTEDVARDHPWVRKMALFVSSSVLAFGLEAAM